MKNDFTNQQQIIKEEIAKIEHESSLTIKNKNRAENVKKLVRKSIKHIRGMIKALTVPEDKQNQSLKQKYLNALNQLQVCNNLLKQDKNNEALLKVKEAISQDQEKKFILPKAVCGLLKNIEREMTLIVGTKQVASPKKVVSPKQTVQAQFFANHNVKPTKLPEKVPLARLSIKKKT